ncbi:MAG TPA: sigma-70 family RNA polymerase sigma factor [Solirubrobacteraceae bacterium]|jgi:RNA polymerase sigma-70 factor (ECF subfamily)|nr:sigma-70 family RNA polymerase sigma factor [Solirubrobacteraceae bacterium]
MTPDKRFQALYHAHAGAVLSYARRRSTRADAEDVLGEVFLVAWRRLDEVPAEQERVWLLGVARRALANQRRGSTRRRALRSRLASQGQAPAAAPMPFPAARETRLGRALARLSESDRELLLLIAWEGLSNEEAARVLEIRPRALRVRLHRARRRLASVLAREGSGDATDNPTALEAL